jgi:hypothetical protein
MDLLDLWTRLNRPSPEIFRRELRRRGIAAPSAAEIRKIFYQYQGEKQIFSRPPKYKGHITSSGPDAKWFADVMFIDAPYLVVVDEFTRYTWVERLKRVEGKRHVPGREPGAIDAASGFYKILERVGHGPGELVTDEDPAFKSAEFAHVLGGVPHVWKAGQQDLSVVDRMIGTIKRNLHGRTVQEVVDGINETKADVLLTSPDEMRGPHPDKNAIFERLRDEADNMEYNSQK